MSATVCLLFATVFCVLVRGGVTTECYECTDCKTPFNPANADKETCDGPCYKLRSTKGLEIRGCVPPFIDTKTGCVEGSFMGLKGTACACEQDLCNAGTRQFVDLPLAVILCVILLVMMKIGVY